MVQLVEQEEQEEWNWQEAEALESCVGEQFQEGKEQSCAACLDSEHQLLGDLRKSWSW